MTRWLERCGDAIEQPSLDTISGVSQREQSQRAREALLEWPMRELQQVPHRRQRQQHAFEDLVLQVGDERAVVAEREQREPLLQPIERSEEHTSELQSRFGI